MAFAVPNPGGNGALAGVACASPTACWAVGSYGNDQGGLVNEALGWDGMKWSLADTPNPGGTGQFSGGQELHGVACASAGKCFAVGSYATGTGASAISRSEILRWNGTKWSLAATPDPGGTTNSHLAGIARASTSRCFAVGSYRNSTGAGLDEVLHWNGSEVVARRDAQPRWRSKLSDAERCRL